MTPPVVASFHEATVEWNRALYGALLIAPPEVAAEIPELDREVDRLLDLAVARVWTRAEFRRERARLGRMAAAHLRLARTAAGLPGIELRSIWTWDDVPEPALAGDSQPEAVLRQTVLPDAVLPDPALRDEVLPDPVLPDGKGAASP